MTAGMAGSRRSRGAARAARGGARDFQVLDTIGEPGAAHSQQDLGDRLGINRTTMVKLIDRFEAAGQVIRTRNPDDRRSYVLGLTGEGHRALRAAREVVEAAEAELGATLGADGRAEPARLLTALVEGHDPAA
ncbi:MarR family winged helix-turn-helix transcriptional regulator [Streptomyces sp. NPDC021224]|uniref:MarR family winged helix-turn-helix transcriptional regulator n=1 Tax=unclassified Streptomyces TaxID=2593676 RepID=UPI0037B3DA19